MRSLLAFILAAALPASAQHDFACAKRAGIEKARCERHEAMFAKCGPLKGEAHHACDRDFLAAHPLRCDALAGDDAARCAKEVEAFQRCQPRAGGAFMRCVRDATGESPMGH